MLTWLSANLATILISAVLLAVVISIIRYLIRQKKQGKSTCGGSCGGGGRYDKMVGKFTGNDVPACGFSIGFERIIMLLMERGFKVPTRPKQVAYLIEKGVSGERLCEVIAQAQEARKDGTQVLVARMNKNFT